MIQLLDFDDVLHPLSRATGTFALVPHFEQVIRDYPDINIVASSSDFPKTVKIRVGKSLNCRKSSGIGIGAEYLSR